MRSLLDPCWIKQIFLFYETPMSEKRRVTIDTKEVANKIINLLRQGDSLSAKDFAKRLRVSTPTVNRALQWVRDVGALIEYSATTKTWRLADPNFTLPLLDPAVDDLQAVLTAAGLLQAIQQEKAAKRAFALFNELAAELGAKKKIRADSLRVTQSSGIIKDPNAMLLLLRSVRRYVVEITYLSPWSKKRESSTHELEPWQVWLAEGVLYVQGYSVSPKEPRTFSLAGIEAVKIIEGRKPSVVPPSNVSEELDLRYGVDLDRPSNAVLVFRGPIARFVATRRWFPKYDDRWIKPDELLERRFAYRSCRELARRLVSLADGLESIDPPELKDELVTILRSGLSRLEPNPQEVTTDKT
jgi:predicted DNA-binding transcriptional regulator YafY